MANKQFSVTVGTIIQYGSISYTMTDKFCNLDITCCTQTNNITLTKNMESPRFVMLGTYDCKIVMYNSDDSIARCITTSVDVK